MNKKTVLSVIGVIVLIIAISGISYAMFIFAGTGTRDNVINVGQISISYDDEVTLALTNRYPEDDIVGINNNSANSTLSFTVSSNTSGNQVINYAIGLVNIDEGATLTEEYVKIYVLKDNTLVSGFEENTGKTVKSFSTNKIEGYINDHAILTDTISGDRAHHYTIKAWVSNEYDLPITDTSSGDTHSNETTSETFSFKIKVVGTDSALVIGNNLDTSGANIPDLATGMIPVYYDSTNDVWKKADEANNNSNYQWYSYEFSGDKKGMWANAVTVDVSNTTIKDKYFNNDMSIKVTNGTEVSMSDINTMWVWIPRFTVNTGGFSTQAYFENIRGEATGTCSDTTYTTESDCVSNAATWTNNYLSPGAINVSFANTSTAALDAFWWDEDSDGVADDGEQKSGFWYGKFETSSDIECTAANFSALGSDCNLAIIKPKIIPNVTSWRGAQVSTFFTASRSMEDTNNMYGFVASEVDTHVSKNNEWGAAAYLTQSIYGRCSNSTTCDEVTKNNCNIYTAGIGGDTVDEGQSSTTCTIPINQYNGAKGVLASTTGTIYGVYDMSGGAWECVMGNYNNMSGYSLSSNYNSGFNGAMYEGNPLTTGTPFPESKYVNIYTGTSYMGHALSETAVWYSDFSTFVNSSFSWFARGGWFNAVNSGVFAFFNGNCDAIGDNGSRFALVK